METMKQIDYPAAHSMDTYWFAIDEAGEVAFMKTGETGPVPEGPRAVDGIFTLLEYLDKDECGIPVFPIPHDPFPDGWTTAELENILASLPDEQRATTQKLAFQTGLSAEEKLTLKKSVGRGFRDCVAVLAEPGDANEFDKASSVIRLDPSKPVFHIREGAYVDALCLLVKGRLLAWRQLKCIRDDLDCTSSLYGMYVFKDHYPNSEYLHEYLCPPTAPAEYERVTTPKKPRIGLPVQVGAGKLIPAPSGEGEPSYLPPVHFVPGVRFAKMASFQLADFIPCYSWSDGHLVPDSADSRVRRNMAIVHQADSPERDRHIAEWRHAAEHGDLVAQYSLAYFYSQGSTTDNERMLHWYRTAAELAEAIPSDSADMFENGSAAQCLLADMYERGIVVPQDDLQAFYWYSKSATKGNCVAQHRLGMMYKNGQVVTEDRVQARVWLAKSAKQDYWPARHVLWDFPNFEGAEQGDMNAQYELAGMYEEGRGVEKDDERALYWYRQSAAQGQAYAQHRLGKMYMVGQKVPTDMALAREWFAKSAAQGHEDAKRLLQDTEIWFAAEHGDLKARYSLAYLYQQWTNYPQAVYWYRLAAEQAEATPVNSPSMFENGSAAQCNLADKYEHGHGVPQDYEQALYWYRKSAAKNNYVAQYSLGVMYMIGTGVPKDMEQARAWLTQSAEQGYSDAQSMLKAIAAVTESQCGGNENGELD